MQRVFGALVSLLQATATALACFGLLNLSIGLFGGPDRNALWVRGLGAPRVLVAAAVAAFALGLLLRHRHRAADVIGRVGGALLALLCALDAAGYLTLRATGHLGAGWLISSSLVLALLLWVWALRPRETKRRAHPVSAVLSIGAATGGLVLLHLFTFGATDYRAPADAAVVFGAAVRPGGNPSRALLDRTTTACALYEEGLVRHLVLSGGRDPHAQLSEPACMAKIALEHGVPRAALLLDETGASSAASLRALERLAHERGWQRVLLVSHDYHLARLNLLARTLDIEVRTVPALESLPLVKKPYYVLREVAAWAWHFVRTSV